MKTLSRSKKPHATAIIGPLVASYQPRQFSSGLRGVLAFLVLSGVLASLSAAGWFYQHISAQNGSLAAIQWSLPWVLLACLILLGYIILILGKTALSTNVIDLYQNGLEIFRFLHRPIWIPLDEIDAVVENPVSERFLFIKWRSIYHLQVVTTSEKKIHFHPKIANLPELAAHIKAKIYPIQRKYFDSRLQVGEAVRLGQVILTNGSLCWKRHIIPWNSLHKIEVKAGFIIIEHDRAPWRKREESTMPVYAARARSAGSATLPGNTSEGRGWPCRTIR